MLVNPDINEIPEKAEIFSLFPTPVIKKILTVEFTDEQMDIFKNAEQRPNAANTSSVNNNILDLECMQDFKNILEKQVQQYFTDILGAPEETTPYITQSWLNWTTKDQKHHPHSHQNSIVSGVVYIETDEEDKIYFYNPNIIGKEIRIITSNFNTFNSPTWWIKADAMSLVLFPSTLIHEVAVKTSPGVRISLSFNTFVRGSLGSDSDLNYLPLR
jgi:uncharacterized protein (TIGR02466 family)